MNNAILVYDRLLDGEDPNTADPRQVEHWVMVYTQLAAGVDRSIAANGPSLSAPPPAIEERDAMYRRLTYWLGRWRQLDR
jgi:hypothetical protein